MLQSGPTLLPIAPPMSDLISIFDIRKRLDLHRQPKWKSEFDDLSSLLEKLELKHPYGHEHTYIARAKGDPAILTGEYCYRLCLLKKYLN